MVCELIMDFVSESQLAMVLLLIERNPFSAQNQTLRSYRVYISPTKQASSALRSGLLNDILRRCLYAAVPLLVFFH